ncbi:scavenger receptor class B member 1-like isoform X2 [Cylas formicarius]|nr:scavenger receptor class B member 1-like isoform X2 [Cylas formicarius]
MASAFLLFSWGIESLVYIPFQTFMDQRIKMIPGFPAYEWWLHPPDEVLMKVYVFNVTNSERFLNGTDKKLRIKEIGPLIYREKLTHSNPIFNENGTFTYTANRTAIFLPEMNTISLNDSIVVPNLAVLLMPAYFYDASMIVKLGINIMIRTYNAQPLVKTTIHNFLWNMTDPVLMPAQKIAPSLVPTTNVGILDRIYSNFIDNVTVFIGSKHGHGKFFTIDRYDGSDNLPNSRKCENKYENASEGVSYPQYLSKNYTIKYWRKTLCKVAELLYNDEQYLYGVKAFRYVLDPFTYNRTQPSHKDCYKGVGDPLPNGLADVSSCYFGYPMAASFPHYLYADDVVKSYVEGLQPDEDKHGSYVILEPFTGIPLQGKARSQINLVMKKFWGFGEKIQRFSDLTVPLCWIEYYQVGIPAYIQNLTFFVVVLVPLGQLPFSLVLVSSSMALFYLCWFRWKKRREKQLLRNKILTFESEKFIK